MRPAETGAVSKVKYVVVLAELPAGQKGAIIVEYSMAFSGDTFTFHKTTLSISPSFVQFYKLTEVFRLRFTQRI